MEQSGGPSFGWSFRFFFHRQDGIGRRRASKWVFLLDLQRYFRRKWNAQRGISWRFRPSDAAWRSKSVLPSFSAAAYAGSCLLYTSSGEGMQCFRQVDEPGESPMFFIIKGFCFLVN